VIDFRYHLVSIVAVFLALAVGIVLGSTELRGAAFSALDRTSSALSAKLNAANSENSTLQQEVNGDRSFAQAAEPVLLAHLLDGKRAVVITAPGAPGGVVSGLTTALGDAGATVSGQVSLTTKFADTSASTLNILDQLTQRVVPSGVNLVSGSPQQQAAQVLASALLSPSGSQSAGQTTSSNTSAGQAGSSPQTILSSYSAGGFLTVSGQPASGATLAVIVVPASPPSGGNADPANQAIIALAQEFGTASQATVVAGASPAAGQGSAITAVRASGAANNASTVDNADAVSGQIVAVQALEQQLSGHKPGSYGTQPDAASAAPSPAPTASVSPTATAKAASGKGKK
jgi:hypothetical protein